MTFEMVGGSDELFSAHYCVFGSTYVKAMCSGGPCLSYHGGEKGKQIFLQEFQL